MGASGQSDVKRRPRPEGSENQDGRTGANEDNHKPGVEIFNA